MSQHSPKRPHCNNCQRPASVCLCHHITAINNTLNVIIYRHPSERSKAVGTAALTSLSLQHCQLIDGEQVNLAADIDADECLLVFPEVELPKNMTPVDTQNSNQQAHTIKHLIFLDGTWKKARKMYYLSPALHTLKKLTLDLSNTHANYQIRKAEKPGQLSTLEAVACALSQLEQKPDKYQPLLALQQAMVEQQLAAMPAEIKHRYP
ncbi:hypothetical protein SIN8267_00622 [Sinobacterium norvegicum]|uniref:tRNA-uridine aminocarboxypropyltransferase n=1 Tax=Sinobacterium norvegicum TaxID=1641715 RepID=A0ABM9ABF2_9GAMM|nr:tRNA-uridine aminocarboxypropyltransferase [Sinobacterium norvegicum]CAH0990530.1 hypothetical protein SIN8267_00622 [Sinobacterium norvegicum]